MNANTKVVKKSDSVYVEVGKDYPLERGYNSLTLRLKDIEINKNIYVQKIPLDLPENYSTENVTKEIKKDNGIGLSLTAKALYVESLYDGYIYTTEKEKDNDEYLTLNQFIGPDGVDVEISTRDDEDSEYPYIVRIDKGSYNHEFPIGKYIVILIPVSILNNLIESLNQYDKNDIILIIKVVGYREYGYGSNFFITDDHSAFIKDIQITSQNIDSTELLQKHLRITNEGIKNNTDENEQKLDTLKRNIFTGLEDMSNGMTKNFGIINILLAINLIVLSIILIKQ